MKEQMRILLILTAILLIGTSAFAQKGLYVGAGLGYCGLGGDIKDRYDPGAGFHFMLGFKASEKLGLELEYGAYEQKPKTDESTIDQAAFGGIQANLKYFFGPRRERPFRPYFVGGLAASAFAWKLKETVLTEDKEDAIGALSLVPGLGFEWMVGRIAALNLSGRYALTMWADETQEGNKVNEDFSSNALLVNVGLILHL